MSGRDSGSPKIPVLWTREIPQTFCNMEYAAVERYLFDTFALDKLRKKRLQGFSISLSLRHTFACLDNVISTPGELQALWRKISETRLYFMKCFCISPGSFGIAVDSRKSLKGYFLHWKTTPGG